MNNNRNHFNLDKSRNRSSRQAQFFLWAYRVWVNDSVIFKPFANIILFFYRTIGVAIETKSIGGGLRMPHLNGIYIHPGAVIGENCTILQQVTIGANEHRIDHEKAAKIGDRVYIGAGAKIIGDIVIGDDVRIGANAVVTKNIPAGMTVVGYNKVLKLKAERPGVI